MPRSNQKP